eukprot:TRINITY_DN6238_c0_g1_i1.p1 TRINITY_DN6238_c0_g1~~TRINITY_DN6238_c0_g1_i1.p1  ORF type:complete len:211 (-),score=-22.47 TRINITY_DN6238_c0_g1_i1:485-1117(-)
MIQRILKQISIIKLLLCYRLYYRCNFPFVGVVKFWLQFWKQRIFDWPTRMHILNIQNMWYHQNCVADIFQKLSINWSIFAEVFFYLLGKLVNFIYCIYTYIHTIYVISCQSNFNNRLFRIWQNQVRLFELTQQSFFQNTHAFTLSSKLTKLLSYNPVSTNIIDKQNQIWKILLVKFYNNISHQLQFYKYIIKSAGIAQSLTTISANIQCN